MAEVETVWAIAIVGWALVILSWLPAVIRWVRSHWQIRLTPEKKDLLRAMATGKDRALIMQPSGEPMYVQAGTQAFRDLDDPSVGLRYMEALDGLGADGLAESIGSESGEFRPTVKGLKIGRKLAARASATD